MMVGDSYAHLCGELRYQTLEGEKTMTMKLRVTFLCVSAASVVVTSAQSLPNLFPLPNGNGLLETYNINSPSV
jgi:hypothetical protein